MTIRRARAGGETVGGKFFKGGQFIGAEWIAKEQGGFNRIAQAAEKATFDNLRHAAFSISKNAKARIKKSKKPSEPGEAPTTRQKGGHNLKGAIFVSVDRDSALIGPRYSFVGDSAEAHEFGVDRKGDEFEERPFMGPSLQEAIPRFASDWQGSIGE